MKKILILLAIVFTSNAFAQQEYLYTQYFDNMVYYNPAATGMKPFHTATSFFRKQWAGIEGSPYNALISYDAPFKKHNMGLGGFVSREVIGVTYSTNIMVNYAYHIKTSQNTRLALGLGAGMDIYTSRLNELTYWDQDDQVYANTMNGKVIPHFGFGMMFHMEKLRVGISIPRLFNINTDDVVHFNLDQAPNLQRHYYFIAEYDFHLKNNWMLTPSTFLRYVKNAPFQADISLRATYDKQLVFGASYRTLGFASVFAQYLIKDFCRIGYSFDFTTTAIRQFSQGTHEIILSFEFLKKEKEVNSSF